MPAHSGRGVGPVASPVGAASVVAFGLVALGIAGAGAPRLSRDFATDNSAGTANRGTTPAED